MTRPINVLHTAPIRVDAAGAAHSSAAATDTVKEPPDGRAPRPFLLSVVARI